jgi:primosomal protein N' (replication factor Y)
MLSLFCDVSLPVPLDQPFTYLLPETLRQRVKTGCRVLVPFGQRTVAGVVLRTHNEPPPAEPRQVLRLLDEEPVLDTGLLKLGRWIAEYYCAPLGETLRAMTPLAADIRHGKLYSLTSSGHDAARQFHLDASAPDSAADLLRLLDQRPLTGAYLARKVPKAASILRALEKKGLVESEDRTGQRHHRAAAPPLSDAPEPAPEIAPRIPRTLNPHQAIAFAAIHEALDAGEFRAFLLEGITGSGKTEVYLSAIEAALARGRSALMLVPEIGLTPAVADQFHHRFRDRVAILHSAFNDTERADQWRRIRSGGATVVVATRSGVFAPLQDLGLIVVDEEHDQSYKQQEAPRYNGRDVAVVRARNVGAVVVLGSATPSLETRYNAERGKYTRVELPERIERRPLPQVQLIDMRQEFLETRKQVTFSRTLIDAVTERLANGEQTMLLMNRRGFSSFVVCRACGQRVECVNCSVTLTYHRRDRRMLCHYCNYSTPVPKRCPKCESEFVQFVGAGSERVEEEMHAAFPRARIARLDRDTVRGKHDYETILSGFRAGDFDVLVGTQMIAKGHDIPNVTLVGVVNADVGLGLPDFRAAERTFQLLTQAAGRAGRGDIAGIVLIQTINPEHYAIRCAAAQDYEMFYAKEIEFRRLMWYPPFGALANVVVRAAREEEALTRSGALGRLLQPAPEGVKILGPAPAAVARLKNEYRFQMLLKTSSRARLGEILAELRRFAAAERWPQTSLLIDVDPMTLL